MSHKRERFELFERESRAKHNDKVCEGMFDDLFSKIREYAQQRRLEELNRKSRGDPMDVSQLRDTWSDWNQSDHWNSGDSNNWNSWGSGDDE